MKTVLALAISVLFWLAFALVEWFTGNHAAAESDLGALLLSVWLLIIHLYNLKGKSFWWRRRDNVDVTDFTGGEWTRKR